MLNEKSIDSAENMFNYSLGIKQQYVLRELWFIIVMWLISADVTNDPFILHVSGTC